MLTYHVVAGQLTAADAMLLHSATNANVTQADITASIGVIYVILGRPPAVPGGGEPAE